MPAHRRDRSAASDASPRRQAQPPGHAQYSLANLPPPLTSFIGRERELSEVAHLLDSTRLLTLIGVGGCGKTRLALQLAIGQTEAYDNSVCWLDLAGLAEPALVTQSAAQALGLRETSHEALPETLSAYLKTKHLLLILDNCEHLLAACRELVEALLLACPTLKVLATSREPLATAGELAWLVPALSLPDPAQLLRHENHLLSQLGHYDAIRLFVERARSVVPTFALTNQNRVAVAQICQRLDGMPLAIELAAARVNVLAVQQIAERLDDRFAFLTGGNRTALLPRHQTLRATMDWSYDLLPEQERILLRRLSVFAGGFTLETAGAVCGGGDIPAGGILDLLWHLIDKSLVVADTQQHNEARYHLLETIRQYASDKLRESGEHRLLHNCHRDWCLGFVEHAEPLLRGPEQVAWLDRLETEYGNLRAALAWSGAEARPKTSASAGSEDTELRLAGTLFWFWKLRGYWSEGRHWLKLALEWHHESSRTMAGAKALFAAGELARLQGDHAAEQRQFEQSAAVWRSLVAQFEAVNEESGRDGNARLLSPLKRGLALALSSLGMTAFSFHSDHARAHALIEESIRLSMSIGAKWELGYALCLCGHVSLYEGDYVTARDLLDESLKLFRETGDQWGLGSALHWRGRIALAQSDYELAHARLDEALAIFHELGDKWNIALSLNHLGETARSQGDDAHALSLYEETVVIHRELGSKWGLCISLHNLAYIALHRGAYHRAADLFKEALSLNLEREDSIGTASCLVGLAGVAATSGASKRAIQLFGKAQAVLDQIGFVLAPADRRELEHNLAVAQAQLDAEAFASAWEVGRTLTLEQAIEIAQSIGIGAPSERSSALVEPLNEREREMLQLIANGLSNHEIADQRVISLSTVKWHINNLFGKLGVRSRTQAIARAKQLGLL